MRTLRCSGLRAFRRKRAQAVHKHSSSDTTDGSFEEFYYFYYIISGSGEMQIADKLIPATAGDHELVPNDVARGFENTSENTT